MRRLRWRILIALLPLLVSVGLVSLGTGLWLSLWVPKQGKAWLETRLEERLPVDVSIGSMRSTVWGGLILTDVGAVDAATGTTWFRAPHLRVSVNLLPWLLSREIGVRIAGAFTAPCTTTASFSGRYHTRSRRLAADLTTTEISIATLIPELRARVPAPLKEGHVRILAHLIWKRETPPSVSGQMITTRLVWEQAAFRATGDATVEGSLTPRASELSPWATDVTIRVEQGQLEGLPLVHQATEVSALLHVTDQALEIRSLRGHSFGELWQLDGTMELRDPYFADFIFRTDGAWVTHLAALVPKLEAWRPDGQAEVTVVCRGPLARWTMVELQGRATLHEAALMWPEFPHRLEHLNGALTYDHLTKQLTLDSLAASVQRHPVTTRGTIRFTTPLELSLTTEATMDLALLTDVAPPRNPLKAAMGIATLAVRIEGAAPTVMWHGTVALEDATLQLRHFAPALERLNGTVEFTRESITTSQLRLRVQNQPLIIAGAVTEMATRPHVVGQARLPNGAVTMDATWHPASIHVEQARLELGDSRVQGQGEIARGPDQASRLTLRGVVDLSDLTQLPWIRLDHLASWSLDGQARMELQIDGPLREWRAIEARGLVQAETLSIKGMPVQSLSAEVEQHQRHAVVRLTNALVADGRLIGQYVLQQASPADRFLLEFDLTRANLEQIAASMPTWRERHLDGALSAHVSLLGDAGARSSYHGDGWLHATGEHLADIPLLDRVLKGFFGALASRLGLAPFRRAQITEIAGQWTLLNERVRTDDLRLSGFSGSEPIAIFVQGSVGLDKTLDLTVEPELSEQLVLEAPNTSTPANTILKTVGGLERLRRLVGRHHLGGTIDTPDYKFEVNLDQLFTEFLPAGLQGLLESLR